MRRTVLILCMAGALSGCDEEALQNSEIYAPCEHDYDCAYDIRCLASPYGSGGMCSISCAPAEGSMPGQCNPDDACDPGCCLTVSYDFSKGEPVGGYCIPYPLEGGELSGFFAPCQTDYDCMPGMFTSPYWGGCTLTSYLPEAFCTTGCEHITDAPADEVIGTCPDAPMCPATGCCLIEEPVPDRTYYYRGTCVPDSAIP